MNDAITFNVQNMTPRRYAEILKANFDRLYAEGEQSGTVMCIPLHAYLIGQPFRLGPFEEVLEYITGHDGVWVTTGREIADYWIEHYYDAALADIHAKAEVV
jgi:hypothetical protein